VARHIQRRRWLGRERADCREGTAFKAVFPPCVKIRLRHLTALSRDPDTPPSGGNSVAAGYQVPNAATLVNLKVGDHVDCAVYNTRAVTVSAGGAYFTVLTVARH
jgi:hypothetical protein